MKKEEIEKIEIIENTNVDLSWNLPTGITTLSEDEIRNISGGSSFSDRMFINYQICGNLT